MCIINPGSAAGPGSLILATSPPQDLMRWTELTEDVSTWKHERIGYAPSSSDFQSGSRARCSVIHAPGSAIGRSRTAALRPSAHHAGLPARCYPRLRPDAGRLHRRRPDDRQVGLRAHHPAGRHRRPAHRPPARRLGRPGDLPTARSLLGHVGCSPGGDRRLHAGPGRSADVGRDGGTHPRAEAAGRAGLGNGEKLFDLLYSLRASRT